MKVTIGNRVRRMHQINLINNRNLISIWFKKKMNQRIIKIINSTNLIIQELIILIIRNQMRVFTRIKDIKAIRIWMCYPHLNRFKMSKLMKILMIFWIERRVKLIKIQTTMFKTITLIRIILEKEIQHKVQSHSWILNNLITMLK